MGNYSDIIDLLTLQSNLAAGVSYVSPIVIIGQYTSFTISIFSDVSLTILVEYSNNGFDWDINDSFNVAASVKTHQSLVVLAKWLRITTTNTSLGSSSIMREFVYGNTSNVTSQSILVSSIAGKFSNVNIANFPDSFNVDTMLPIQRIPYRAFTSGTGGGFTAPVPGMSCYTDRGAEVVIVNGGGTGTVNLHMPTAVAGSFVYLTHDHPVTIPSGSSAIMEWSCKMGSTESTNYNKFAGFFRSDAPDNVALNIVDGIGVGFTGTNSTPPRGIGLWRNSTFEFVPQSAWNVDTFEGAGQADLVLNLSEMNSFRVLIDDKNGTMAMQIKDTNGKYRTAHIFPNSDGPSLFASAAFSPGQYLLSYGTASSTTDEISMKEAILSLPQLEDRGVYTPSVSFGGSIVGNTGLVRSVKNGTTLNGVSNEYSLLKLSSITSVMEDSAGTGVVKDIPFAVYIVRNSPLTGASFFVNNNFSTIEFDVSGTPTAGTIGTVSSENKIKQYVFENYSGEIQLMDENIYLFSGDVMTFYIKNLTTTNVAWTLNFNFVEYR